MVQICNETEGTFLQSSAPGRRGRPLQPLAASSHYSSSPRLGTLPANPPLQERSQHPRGLRRAVDVVRVTASLLARGFPAPLRVGIPSARLISTARALPPKSRAVTLKTSYATAGACAAARVHPKELFEKSLFKLFPVLKSSRPASDLPLCIRLFPPPRPVFAGAAVISQLP